MTSVTCPACRSMRIVIVVSPRRRAFCGSCGARWMDDPEPVGAAKATGAPVEPSARKSS
jgi:transposase-like protein